MYDLKWRRIVCLTLSSDHVSVITDADMHWKCRVITSVRILITSSPPLNFIASQHFNRHITTSRAVPLLLLLLHSFICLSCSEVMHRPKCRHDRDAATGPKISGPKTCKVPHKRLLLKLAAHGIRGELLLWIENWLSGRKQSYIEWSVFQLERSFKWSSTKFGIGVIY